MKTLLTALLLLVFIPGYSQKHAVTVYDSLWNLTIKDFGAYYRVGVLDTVNYQYHGEVRDFYMDGKLQMKGNYNVNGKVDTFYFYFPNGQLKMKGPYQNNVRYGTWTSYYENGHVKDKVVYNNEFLAALEHYDEEGNPRMKNGTGAWEVMYSTGSSMDLKMIKGFYKDSLMHGTWEFYTKSKKVIPGVSRKEWLECTEVYEEGRFVKGKYYHDGRVHKVKSPVIEILPESIKFEKTETWKHSQYATIEAYPYLKFLPSEDSTILPVDEYAQFPELDGSLTDYFKKNLRLSNSYMNSKRPKTIGAYILIGEEGKLNVIKDPAKEYMHADPDNQKFYDQVHIGPYERCLYGSLRHEII